LDALRIGRQRTFRTLLPPTSNKTCIKWCSNVKSGSGDVCHRDAWSVESYDMLGIQYIANNASRRSSSRNTNSTNQYCIFAKKNTKCRGLSVVSSVLMLKEGIQQSSHAMN